MRTLTIVLLFVILLCLNIFNVVFNENLHKIYDEKHLKVLDYLMGKDVELDFNRREVSHLSDVRRVIGVAYIVFVVSLLGFGVLGAFLKPRELGKVFVRSGIAVIVFSLVLGVISKFAFRQVFRAFHLILFPQGNWMFDPAVDTIVVMYPTMFWSRMFVSFFVNVIVSGIILVILGYVIKFKNKKGIPN